MASQLELSRLNHVLELINKQPNKVLDEFQIKNMFKWGSSTYQQMKREVKMNSLWQDKIRVESKRGQADLWRSLVDG